MPSRHGHVDVELRCSAFLPLSEMTEAFEAAMELIDDDEAAKGEIIVRWNEAIEELSRDLAVCPTSGRHIAVSGAADDAELTPPVAQDEWAERVDDCLAEPATREMVKVALAQTAAYRVGRIAFVGEAPDRFVREFLRRAVAELLVNA